MGLFDAIAKNISDVTSQGQVVLTGQQEDAQKASAEKIELTKARLIFMSQLYQQGLVESGVGDADSTLNKMKANGLEDTEEYKKVSEELEKAQLSIRKIVEQEADKKFGPASDNTEVRYF